MQVPCAPVLVTTQEGAEEVVPLPSKTGEMKPTIFIPMIAGSDPTLWL